MHVDLQHSSITIKLNAIPKTLHKVNDTMWQELFPEIWHPSGTQKVLRGRDARAKWYLWSHKEAQQMLIYQWHTYCLVSANSIRRFICKASEKPEAPWHGGWEPPRSGQYISSAQNREERSYFQIVKEIKCPTVWFHNMVKYVKLEKLFCLKPTEYFLMI